MTSEQDRRLMQRSEVADRLHLTIEDVDTLVSTDQLTELRICGRDLIDSWDVDRLIDSYKTNARRRVQ